MCQLSRARKGCGAPSFQPGNDAAAICFAGRYLEVRRAKSRLSPVAFDKHVIVPAMLPPMIHPSGMRPRRRYPHTCRPHVRMAIPAMIAALVDIAALRSPAAHFDHRARRRHLHNNLGAHRADRQQAARNCGKNCSSHFFPFLGRSSRKRGCFKISQTGFVTLPRSSASRTADRGHRVHFRRPEKIRDRRLHEIIDAARNLQQLTRCISFQLECAVLYSPDA
jgi:hypothetical protein